jgi:hypothetical protein
MALHHETAGWAVHLVLNANATLGRFDVPDLAKWLERTPRTDAGLIGAAITYGAHEPHERLIARRLGHVEAHEAMQSALGEGLKVNETVLHPPRFLASSEHWRARARWGVNNEALERLGLPFADPDALLQLLREATPDAIKQGASGANLDEFLGRLERGDARALATLAPNVPLGRLRREDIDPVQLLVLVSELMTPSLLGPP